MSPKLHYFSFPIETHYNIFYSHCIDMVKELQPSSSKSDIGYTQATCQFYHQRNFGTAHILRKMLEFEYFARSQLYGSIASFTTSELLSVKVVYLSCLKKASQRLFLRRDQSVIHHEPCNQVISVCVCCLVLLFAYQPAYIVVVCSAINGQF